MAHTAFALIAGTLCRLRLNSLLPSSIRSPKIEVARTYVTGDVIARLERRIDDMVSSVREEMKETREQMIRAFMEGRPRG